MLCLLWFALYESLLRSNTPAEEWFLTAQKNLKGRGVDFVSLRAHVEAREAALAERELRESNRCSEVVKRLCCFWCANRGCVCGCCDDDPPAVNTSSKPTFVDANEVIFRFALF